MPFFPTEQWLTEYGRLLDESDALDDLAVGMGERFDGDVLFVIEDLPLAETTLDDLPDHVLDGIPEAIRAEIADVTLADAPDTFDETIRPTLSDVARDLLEQIETNVVDGNVYATVSLSGGDCNGVAILDGPDERDADFVFRGPYETWRSIVDGRPPAAALIRGDLQVEGSLVQQLQYAAMFQLLGEITADVETVHLFAGTTPSTGDRVFEQAVTHPAFVQKTAHRHIVRSLNRF